MAAWLFLTPVLVSLTRLRAEAPRPLICMTNMNMCGGAQVSKATLQRELLRTNEQGATFLSTAFRAIARRFNLAAN